MVLESCKDYPEIADPDSTCWNETEIADFLKDEPIVQMIHSFSFVDFNNASHPF